MSYDTTSRKAGVLSLIFFVWVCLSLIRVGRLCNWYIILVWGKVLILPALWNNPQSCHSMFDEKQRVKQILTEPFKWTCWGRSRSSTIYTTRIFQLLFIYGFACFEYCRFCGVSFWSLKKPSCPPRSPTRAAPNTSTSPLRFVHGMSEFIVHLRFW